MPESLRSLERILNEQIGTYMDLADGIRAQHQLICEGRYNALAKNLEQEIALIARAKYLEQARIELVWEMADRGELPGENLTLSEVIQHVGADDADAASLDRVRSRLRAAVDNLREINARTAELIRVSLHAIDRMRTQVFGNNGKSYTARGAAAHQEKTSVVNRQG